MEEKEIIGQEPTEENTEEVFTKAQVEDLLEKERSSWKEKLIEAEKLAKMNAAEQETYRRRQTETALSEREAAVSRRELMADAVDKLCEYKLPKSLVSCVDLSSPEACINSIEGMKVAFSEAVSLAVNERIRGNIPKASLQNGKDAFLDGLCF